MGEEHKFLSTSKKNSILDFVRLKIRDCVKSSFVNKKKTTFSRKLPYRDQTILLEESWSELFVLTAAQWNFPVDETALVSVDITPERREILLDKARRLRELLAKCAALRVDHSEYACLKAIVLFKPGERFVLILYFLSFSILFFFSIISFRNKFRTMIYAKKSTLGR